MGVSVGRFFKFNPSPVVDIGVTRETGQLSREKLPFVVQTQIYRARGRFPHHKLPNLTACTRWMENSELFAAREL